MKDLTKDQTCDIDIALELQEAGVKFERGEDARSEVPYHLVGKLGNWTFQRKWCYWVVTAPEGEGLPESQAEVLNRNLRKEVRVAGYSYVKDLVKWLSSRRTIDSYSIDTQKGLNTFAEIVRKLK